jgi:hypothetical protein
MTIATSGSSSTLGNHSMAIAITPSGSSSAVKRLITSPARREKPRNTTTSRRVSRASSAMIALRLPT